MVPNSIYAQGEDTKIKLISTMKQRKVLLTKPKPTASQR